ncbi:MAG: FAD-binding oxidoreductase [Gemmatimonadales bacterium]|nr:MAG: FAD-binding oxidoreductase [Gemmatimonadales bacterium]
MIFSRHLTGPGTPPSPEAASPREVRERFPDLLRDESNLSGGSAGKAFLPGSGDDVARIVSEAAGRGATLSIGGARTGISGGAVPGGDSWVLSLQRLRRIHGLVAGPPGEAPGLRVEAGVSLDEVRSWLAQVEGGRWIYPVDPTEWSASVGGTVATNAAGGRSYHYGATSAWVRALRVVLPDGTLVELRRGDVTASDDAVSWDALAGGGLLGLPRVKRPRVRCVAGYDIAPGGDLVDAFVGSEGTLGVVVEAELALAPAPKFIVGLFCFVHAEASVPDLVPAIRELEGFSVLAIEYLDPASLDLLREERRAGRGGEIPVFPDHAGAAFFLELAFEDEAEVEAGFECLERVLSGHGGSLDDIWAGFEPADRMRMRHLRHAVPEAVNARVARLRRSVPELHKVGTDLAVPDEAAAQMGQVYAAARKEAGMPSVLFGHAAENHLHLNFLPRTVDELARARALHLGLAREAVRLGGSVTAEHGIGRLKLALLPIQFGVKGVEELRRFRAGFDPAGTLNPGVHLP